MAQGTLWGKGQAVGYSGVGSLMDQGHTAKSHTGTDQPMAEWAKYPPPPPTRGGGQRPKKQFVCLKLASNFRPL